MSAWAELEASDGSDEHLVLCERAKREVRAATLREAADRASQIATEFREGEDEEFSSREVRDACEHVAYEISRMADEGEHP